MRLWGCNGCGAVGGMRIGRGNQSSRRKLIQIPLCASQFDIKWPRMGARLQCCIVFSTEVLTHSDLVVICHSKTNSVAWVCQWTIPTEQLPFEFIMLVSILLVFNYVYFSEFAADSEAVDTDMCPGLLDLMMMCLVSFCSLVSIFCYPSKAVMFGFTADHFTAVA
jgi:hypothetical protein